MANPVLIRELRGRWRRPITHIILFAYGAVLALLMGLVYNANVSGVNLANDGASRLLGRNLFSSFLTVQIGVWMLLAAALTAPSIAGERERGLLQGILLSPVTPGAIVRGKLVSSLWFIALLLLVPMPIISICFSLGGLSPQEFIVSFLLLGSTAVSGACLGLAVSACNRRSDTALMSAFAITLTLCWPPVLVSMTFERDYFIVGAVLCMIYQAILTAAALGVTTDALNSVLPEREGEFGFNLEPLSTPLSATLTAGVNSDTSQNAAANKPVKTWKDTPLSARINFKNPVLQREVRARLRRRANESADEYYEQRGVDSIVVIISLSLTLGWTAFLFGSGPVLGVLWLLGAMIISAVSGALSFVREREQKTLQPLLMSLLSPGEVLFGKMGAACFISALYVGPFLSMVLLGLSNNWLMMPLMLLLGIGAIWCGAAIGLSLSWICRQSGVAVASSLAAGATMFLLTFFLSMNMFTRPVPVPGILNAKAPILVSTPIMILFHYALPVTGFWLLVGALMLMLVRMQLNPKVLEKDGASIWSRDLTKEH